MPGPMDPFRHIKTRESPIDPAIWQINAITSKGQSRGELAESRIKYRVKLADQETDV